jgi:Arc/MetJ family transcription regulator
MGIGMCLWYRTREAGLKRFAVGDMVSNMKTTIDIADPLLSEIKRLASREGITMRQLVDEGLRRVLEARDQSEAGFRLRDASVDGRGVQAGLSEGDWASIRDLVYEGRGA